MSYHSGHFCSSSEKVGVTMWKFEIYEDSGGHYRWRLKSSNGQKVATSGESFAFKVKRESRSR
jgi:uncharacterized protein YegP (UPF0339 family)